MIDPTIFTIDIANFTLSLHWYGVLVMLGVAAAVWLTTIEFGRLGADPDYVWDCLIWVVPAGVIGARLWYVLNSTLGGSTKYILDPLSIINLKEGGLHFYGAILFGTTAFWIYAKQK